MRFLLLMLITALFFIGAGHFFYGENSLTSSRKTGSIEPKIELQHQRLKQVVLGIKTKLTSSNFNNRLCFLVDMKIHSGSKRFFVYDTKKDSVLLEGLVTHGGGDINNRSIQFSNIEGSNCTSLGSYKIGKSYNGKFGLAYKLYGLEKTNSNAYNRFVVLHAHPCVPDQDISPANICCSLGCPTVSPTFLQQLKVYLDKPGKPILLRIFN